LLPAFFKFLLAEGFAGLKLIVYYFDQEGLLAFPATVRALKDLLGQGETALGTAFRAFYFHHDVSTSSVRYHYGIFWRLYQYSSPLQVTPGELIFFKGVIVKAVIMPGFSELIIIVNPTREVSREGMLSIVMPWLYAPWPQAKEKGIVEMEFGGDTLRALLLELSARYKAANVDFQPVNPATNDLDFDYDVLVNDKNYVALSGGLDARLKDGDRVKVKMLWRWDG
jgi:molybdopterin converting factor small subunit